MDAMLATAPTAELNATGRRCPACNGISSSRCAEKNGFELLFCNKCRTLYTADFPKASAEMDYDDYYAVDNLSVPTFVGARLDEIISGFSRYRRNNRLLEVGFGAGTILEAASRAGWEVFGVEVSSSAVEHAKARGFDVFNGELREAKYPAEHFDVVVASEILEHISDPQNLLGEVSRVLRPGGLFWATTPNSRSVSARVLGAKWSAIAPPEHLHLFSRRGMRQMLSMAGFRRINIYTEGLNPYEIVEHLKGQTSDSGGEAGHEGHRRVAKGYDLNAAMQTSAFRRSVKQAANRLLRVTFLGDSLKVWAER
jgi:2-polyprenyl-3-methyl-5-hydroxy-6-metoxy-1,4-benzoquinol methylase